MKAADHDPNQSLRESTTRHKSTVTCHLTRSHSLLDRHSSTACFSDRPHLEPFITPPYSPLLSPSSTISLIHSYSTIYGLGAISTLSRCLKHRKSHPSIYIYTPGIPPQLAQPARSKHPLSQLHDVNNVSLRTWIRTGDQYSSSSRSMIIVLVVLYICIPTGYTQQGQNL